MTRSFFWTGFLQSHFFTCFCNCFFFNRKHTAIRLQSHCGKVAITHMLVLQLSFFAITAHQWLQPHCKGCCNHLYCHQVATISNKHQPSRNLTVSWLELFFWTGFFAITLFYLFFATVFCNRSHMLFLQLFLFLQSHGAKGAITLRQGCNHAYDWFSNCIFAIAAHQWLQPHCNLFCNQPYFHLVATTSSKH
jgi:hypothetical protein